MSVIQDLNYVKLKKFLSTRSYDDHPLLLPVIRVAYMVNYQILCSTSWGQATHKQFVVVSVFLFLLLVVVLRSYH